MFDDDVLVSKLLILLKIIYKEWRRWSIKREIRTMRWKIRRYKCI